jgi:hypothetical protein
MDTDAGVKREPSLQRGEEASADIRDTFSDLRHGIQMADERSRCQCSWDYATGNGTQRAHNPLCPVHDRERVLDAIGTQRELTSK